MLVTCLLLWVALTGLASDVRELTDLKHLHINQSDVTKEPNEQLHPVLHNSVQSAKAKAPEMKVEVTGCFIQDQLRLGKAEESMEDCSVVDI